MNFDVLKARLWFYTRTGTGGILSLTVAGGIGAFVQGEPLYFLVPLTGFLVQQSRLETPQVIFQERECPTNRQ